EHRPADGGHERAHDRKVLALAAADADRDAGCSEPLCSGHAHTRTPSRRKPAVSASPRARFAFCTACPAAPLPRLSIAQITSDVPVERSVKPAISAASVPCTRATSGATPSGRTRTIGLDAYPASTTARVSAFVCT